MDFDSRRIWYIVFLGACGRAGRLQIHLCSFVPSVGISPGGRAWTVVSHLLSEQVRSRMPYLPRRSNGAVMQLWQVLGFSNSCLDLCISTVCFCAL